MSSANDSSRLRKFSVEQYGHHAVALQSRFLCCQQGRLQGTDHGVQAEHVALYLVAFHSLSQMAAYLFLVVGAERWTHQLLEVGKQCPCEHQLVICEKQLLVHVSCILQSKITIKS